MPRSLWTGSLSFGLVNVPVRLVTAARDLDFHFHQLHEKDKVRIEQRRFCSEEDVEVSFRAYRLLVDVMERTDRAALGRFVMRTKQYLAAVRVRDGALTLTTMRFYDEVRPTEPIPTGGKKPSRKQVEHAVA